MPESEGMAEESAVLLTRANELKEQFNREFWMPDKGYYAMALDGHHRQVDTITSNPGHCLWTRLIDEEHAEDTANVLLSHHMSSGWGIRSMSNIEQAYNPLSYHNGSVWPFENTLIGAGLKHYGCVDESASVFQTMLEAAWHFEYARWPEVFCGVTRDLLDVMALQPDSSRPQAWSAAAIFLWVKTWLGISPRPFSTHIDMAPTLPPFTDKLTVTDLSISGCKVSLKLTKTDDGSTTLQIVDNPGGLDITLHPLPRPPKGTHPRDDKPQYTLPEDFEPVIAGGRSMAKT